jgi:hypothetical protein
MRGVISDLNSSRKDARDGLAELLNHGCPSLRVCFFWKFYRRMMVFHCR